MGAMSRGGLDSQVCCLHALTPVINRSIPIVHPQSRYIEYNDRRFAAAQAAAQTEAASSRGLRRNLPRCGRCVVGAATLARSNLTSRPTGSPIGRAPTQRGPRARPGPARPLSQDTLPSLFPIPFLAKYYYYYRCGCIIGVLLGYGMTAVSTTVSTVVSTVVTIVFSNTVRADAQQRCIIVLRRLPSWCLPRRRRRWSRPA